MYYAGTFQCAACSATIVVETSDWADLSSGTMTAEGREKIKGWAYSRGSWYCPLHNELGKTPRDFEVP